MARPETEPDIKKSERVALYLTPDDKRNLVGYAQEAQIGVSELLARLMFREAKKSNPYWSGKIRSRQKSESDIKQSVRVGIYLTPEGKRRLVEYAQEARLSTSELLARLVFREAKKSIPYWNKIR